MVDHCNCYASVPQEAYKPLTYLAVFDCAFCLQPNTCADIPGSCGQGYNAKPLTTMVGPAPLYTRDCCSEIGATCGNTLPKNTPAVKYDCSKISPGIYKFDGNKVDQTGPSDTNCCKVSANMLGSVCISVTGSCIWTLFSQCSHSSAKALLHCSTPMAITGRSILH